MPERSIERLLEKFFPHSDRLAWKDHAMRETNDKEPFEILSWRGKDDILFLPYYDAHDVVNLKHLDGFRTPVRESTAPGAKRWINLPPVNVAASDVANAIALDHLSGGADGILFYLQAGSVDRLLDQIHWPWCFLAFHNPDADIVSSLSERMTAHANPNSLKGALFWESIPKKINLDFSFQHFKSLGLSIPHTSPAEEISHALTEGVRTWESFAATSGADPRLVLQAIAFSLETDAAVLETVAKLKALRLLWAHVVQSYGIYDYKNSDLHIHTHSSKVSDDRYEPRENMLKGTFAAIAAVLGGCDSLTLHADEEPASTQRWARNVSFILEEESFLGHIDDPLAGSYAIDSMVNEIAASAWESFQRKMSEA